ncbi:MAG: transglutaminase-like domain-containing protein [Pseudomonadota bacterium]|nr:transglutaminase-like domain-containing protein [Pseudomonadota bacterium]
MPTFIRLFLTGLAVVTIAVAAAPSLANPLAETTEVQFATAAAQALRDKAAALATPVKIYEYLRNNHDFTLYHGARSNSVNAFLGKRGNDVDLASTLVAMLRSRGVPSRYAVGTVRTPAADIQNWLGVKNLELATNLLRDQGIPNVVLAADRSYVDLERVWVEAQVPFGDYRGTGPEAGAINCTAEPSKCTWVGLDPAFKLRRYKAAALDIYDSIDFDYSAYFNALKNNDAARKDKNPLAIYEEQVLSWLRANHPGKTLEDVADPGEIVKEEAGLLPASLPYQVVGTARHYDMVADHDLQVGAAETKKWSKYLKAQVQFEGMTLASVVESVATLSTQKLTFAYNNANPGTIQMAFRLDGSNVSSITAGSIIVNGKALGMGSPLTLSLELDGSGATPITASYSAVFGGYYLIGTGGETSNWSQVNRAADELLQANTRYPIVFNSAESGCQSDGVDCTPYIDSNGNGWDALDPRLLDHPQAMDDLTGGLLYVAMTQYFAKFREAVDRLDGIDHVKSPIEGFVGVVSSVYDVEYVDGTAFSVLPGGLLIDMKGQQFAGNWRDNAPAVSARKHFDLIGHIMSSLEHEIWQEITGYDAISTVHGIQMALANGATLLNPKTNAAGDTLASAYPGFGYAQFAPAGFTRKVYPLFDHSYLSWSYVGTDPANAGFVAFVPDVRGVPAYDSRLLYWTWRADNGIDTFLSNYDGMENALLTAQTTEGQLKTNVNFPSSLTNYQTQDVLSALITSPTGFSVASYARIGAGTYDFVVNETANHTDGVYPLTLSLKLGDAINEATYDFSGLTGYSVIGVSVTSPAGFAVKSYNKPTADTLNVVLKETSAHANATYTVTLQVSLLSNSMIYTWAPSVTVEVASGRWVDVSGTITLGSLDTSDTMNLTCGGGPNGEAVNYSGAPSVVLGNLHACLNNIVSLDGIGPMLDFFDPVATLEYRAVPAASDSQLTSAVVDIRNDLHLRDTSQAWIEYVIPSRLSVGPNYRFSVDVRKAYETSTGDLISALYEIQNLSGISAGGGYVAPTAPFLPNDTKKSRE